MIKLLVGLGSDYDNIHSLILMMQLLPSLNIMCAILQREETRMKVMHGISGEKIEEPHTSQAFCIDHESKENSNFALKVEAINLAAKEKNVLCTYYKKSGHLKKKLLVAPW